MKPIASTSIFWEQRVIGHGYDLHIASTAASQVARFVIDVMARSGGTCGPTQKCELGHVIAWLQIHSKVVGLRNFPRGLGKGFDAALLGAWLGSVVDNVQDGDIPECEKELFRVVQFGLRSTNKFFRLIYCGKLWLPRSVAEQVVRHGWNMLEAYQGCAQLASRKQRSLWYMRPKVHMQSHIVRDLEYQVLAGCDHCLNPACFATWSDEDFIGRIARCARKVHPIQMARNTIKRCLITYRKEWLKVMPPV